MLGLKGCLLAAALLAPGFAKRAKEGKSDFQDQVREPASRGLPPDPTTKKYPGAGGRMVEAYPVGDGVFRSALEDRLTPDMNFGGREPFVFVDEAEVRTLIDKTYDKRLGEARSAEEDFKGHVLRGEHIEG
jgi:hypothetical protein